MIVIKTVAFIEDKPYIFSAPQGLPIYLHYNTQNRPHPHKPVNHKVNQVIARDLEHAAELMKTGKYVIRLSNHNNHTGKSRNGLYALRSVLIEEY